ncbi:MAG TPA: 4a-hydroxytetrahydrobiopterin dehydratase [Candidatus Nanoarchaeia archaeon]|nr:4a-hydroxytetrahydrobiopterin dehydratase [Candidatus Nanoarchaeia archaeon]
MSEWKEEDTLTKEFSFLTFVAAVEFVNKITPLAEQMNHHPDVLVHSYNKVKITLSTHSEHKVTEKDWELVRKIDALFA